MTREALWFAIDLAMPADAFRAAHAVDPSPAALAAAFGVHLNTAAARSKALGLDPRPVHDADASGLARTPVPV